MRLSFLATMVLWGCARDPAADLHYPRIAMAILARVDLDHDGRVSKEEYAQLAFPDEPMDPWDTNEDDALDAREIEAAFLEADTARIQGEGKRAVYEKYGYPFGGDPASREAPE